MSLIKQETGALTFDTTGKCRFVLNWAHGIIEIWCNKERKFVIDMNGAEK